MATKSNKPMPAFMMKNMKKGGAQPSKKAKPGDKKAMPFKSGGMVGKKGCM